MRMIEIILTELASERLKSEEELQRLINISDISVEEQVKKIKIQLENVVKYDDMISKWNSYTTKANANVDNNENNNN
jgi:type I site-specific restriction endonuclease